MKAVNIYTKHTKGGMLHHNVAQQSNYVFKPGLVLLSSVMQLNNMHQFCFNPVSHHWAAAKKD